MISNTQQKVERSFELSKELSNNGDIFKRLLKWRTRFLLHRKEVPKTIYLNKENHRLLKKYARDLCEWGNISNNNMVLGITIRSDKGKALNG